VLRPGALIDLDATLPVLWQQFESVGDIDEHWRASNQR
jgi:hypothetical protein